MKKLKGALSLLLCMIMVFGAVAVGGEGIGKLFSDTHAEAANNSSKLIKDFLKNKEYSSYTKGFEDSTLEYAILDVNSDSIPELFIHSTYDRPFFNTWIFILKDDKVVLIKEEYGYGDFSYSSSENLLLGVSETRPSSTQSYSPFYRLSGSKLELVFSVGVDDGQPFYHDSNGKRSISSSEKNAFYYGFIDFSWSSIDDVTEYGIDDIFEFGSYPQSEVKDSATLEKLNAASKNWISYGYYSGNGLAGSMKPGNWMKYADVTLGSEKYRAVRFTQYRPYYSVNPSSYDNSYQDNNGYTVNNIYYFKYEPLKWQVLDPKTGLVLSKSIIDSQAYSNTVYLYNYEYYSDDAHTKYPNNYAESSIRKWLNGDFYNTAFTPAQKQNILPTMIDNKAFSSDYSNYGSVSTTDNVFFLSYNEVQNTSYGFISGTGSTETRKAVGTDYAKAQGLLVAPNQGSQWCLRSAGFSSTAICEVYDDGDVEHGNACFTNYGVRPAMRLADLNYSEPTPDGMRVIINNTSLSYVKGEEFIIAVSNFKDNVENHIDKLAVMVSNTQILKVQGIYDYGNLPKRIQKDEDLKKCKFIYLKAIGIGSSTVKMTDSDTKITREIPITVSEDTIATLRANEIKTYEYKAWFERDYYNANCDGIWVSDFKCSETTGGWNFSMNLYNENYCCGVLEVYDAQGKLIDVEIIDKFESLTKGIYKTFKAGYTIVRDAIDGDSLSFRSDATSKNTEIKDLFVPQNGHIAVTADSSVSVNCAVTNTFDMLFTSWTLAGDISEFMTNISTLSNDQVKQITKTALAKMIVQSEYLKYGEKLQEKFCEEAAKRVSLTAINSFSSKLFKSADILLDELNLSLNDIVKLALGSGVSIVESVFMKCSGPYGYVLKGMFLFQDACDLLTGINDAGKRLVGDGKFGCYTPLAGTELTTIKNGNVTIDTNGNTESGTVLESYMIKEGLAFVNKINDMVGQEKTSNEFQIYEISLHNRGKKVQPKGNVKVYIDSPYRCATVYRRNDDGSWEIIKSTVKNGVIEFEVDHFCRFAIISYPTLSINTPSVTTVSYGFTLNLHANVTDLPEGARIVWSMDGSGFELIPSADGMTCGVKSVSKGSATITAKVVDKNGNAVKDANGNEIAASQQLTSKAGFFQKLVAFFKKLFGSNMVIPSSLNKLIK